jgi:hypothetical protein
VGRSGTAAALVALALAGCAGGGDDEIFGPEARQAADGFVRALVASGDTGLAGRYVDAEAAQRLELWHTYLLRDGVRTVEGPGSARANCVKAFPVFAPPPPADCITYRLVGLTPIPGTMRTLVVTARLRVWPEEDDDGTWRVVDFDYTPQLESR